MISMAWHILRAFVADRQAAALAILAPIALFTLLALFYRHLESPQGLHFEVAFVDRSGTPDGAAFARALESAEGGRLEIRPSEPDRVAAVEIVVPEGFTRGQPRVCATTHSPIPGLQEAAVQVVNAAHLRAFGGAVVPIELDIGGDAQGLLREGAVGAGVIFMLFAAASLVGRGLGDDAAGFRDRMRALGVGQARFLGARTLAIAAIASVQLALTFAWAALAFNVVPRAPLALLAATAMTAWACAASYVLLASLCGTRARLAAAAPVVSMLLSALSGAMIPRPLLPEGIAAVGGFLFPSWSIWACEAAIGGAVAAVPLALLAAWGAACLVLAAMTREEGST